jgi:uncharacterized protein (DUF433 family)
MSRDRRLCDIGGAFPGIERTLGVAGGEPCIVRTRIPVWVLVQARKLGSSESDILRAYPTLRAEDLTNAWAYYRAHSDEIDRQILANEMGLAKDEEPLSLDAIDEIVHEVRHRHKQSQHG